MVIRAARRAQTGGQLCPRGAVQGPSLVATLPLRPNAGSGRGSKLDVQTTDGGTVADGLEFEVASTITEDLADLTDDTVQLSSKVPGIVYRLRTGFWRERDRQPPALKRLRHKLLEIEAKRRGGRFAHESDLALALLRHMQTIVDTAAILVAKQIKADTGISLKVLWNGRDGTPLVHTLLRDRDSQIFRKRHVAPDYFPYEANTAFSDLLTQAPALYWASDDLLGLDAAGKYHNIHAEWDLLYNTTAVSAVPPKRASESQPILGFLCADSKYGPISSSSVRHIMEELGGLVYTCFQIALLPLPHRSDSDADQTPAPGKAGWSLGEQGPQLIDPAAHEQFQGVVELMEAAHFQEENSLARVCPYPLRIEDGAASLDLNGAGIMADKPKLEEDELDPEVVAEFAHPQSIEEFVETLKEISPGNPYVETLLEKARLKGITR